MSSPWHNVLATCVLIVYRLWRSHRADTDGIDTSKASKERSKKFIEELGSVAEQYRNDDEPRSKSAAENLEGSRAAL